MHVLIANDDGYLAPGVRTLYQYVKDNIAQASTVSLMAPLTDYSAASHSLTLTKPIRVNQHEANVYSVEGTPTDCVHLAVNGFFDEEPDIVLSGINAGPNMGDDVLYSGTVSAAMEARFLGRSSIAFSMAEFNPKHYETAAEIAVTLLKGLIDNPLPAEMILNVNVPDLPIDAIKGIKVTRLGRRHRAGGIIKQQDPRGNNVYWVGPPGNAQDDGPETDFYAVSHGYVSVTPLHIDLTDYPQLESTQHWLATNT